MKVKLSICKKYFLYITIYNLIYKAHIDNFKKFINTNIAKSYVIISFVNSVAQNNSLK